MGLTRQQTTMIAVLLAGAFLVVLNQTLLTPALPTIMSHLNVNATTVQWLTSGYALVEAVIIPLNAYLIGRFSTRKLFTICCRVCPLRECPKFSVFVAGARYAGLRNWCGNAYGVRPYFTYFPARKSRCWYGLSRLDH